MNRRHFLVSVVSACAALPLITLAQPVEITPEPGTELSATPSAELPRFEGPITEVWDNPAAVEGKLVEFTGTILQTFAPAEGQRYAGGDNGLFFNTLLLIEVAGGGGRGTVIVGYNSTIDHLDDVFTVQVVGRYSGLHDYYDPAVNGRWTIPLIAAVSVEAPSIAPGTPEATPNQ